MTFSPENSEYLLTVLRAVINGRTAPPPPEGVDLKEVYELADAHRLAPMAYHGLYLAGLDGEGLAPFRAAHRSEVKLSALLGSEFRRIADKLESAGIEYCPLKGYFTRELYPDPAMRTMSDIDIMIHAEDSERIREIMDGMGYGCLRYMLDDDDKYKRPGLLVEFHRALDSDGLGDPSYYRDPWRLTEPAGGHMRRLRVSDAYLYTAAHALKHFMSSGTGLRSLLDICLYMTKAPIDREYVDEAAKEMGMSRFLRSMEKAAAAAFCGAEADADTREILDFMIGSGVIGSRDTLITSNMMRSGAENGGTKLSYFMKLLFPPFRSMKLRYPVLRDAPALLPVMHIRRLLELAFLKPDRRRAAIERFGSIELSEAEKLKRIHEIAGVGK